MLISFISSVGSERMECNTVYSIGRGAFVRRSFSEYPRSLVYFPPVGTVRPLWAPPRIDLNIANQRETLD